MGRAPDDATLPPVFLRLLEERITVDDLIRRTVEEQVRDLMGRRTLKGEQVRRILDRHYLSEREIAAQAEHGVVRHPADISTKPIDPEAEVQKALRAFVAGTYSILVSGRQVERLDEVVAFTPGSKVVFVRLVPLAGG
jgi:hypothetical protein